MINIEQIIKEANYYLNSDVTVEQASIDLGISKKTLQNHFKLLEGIDVELFNKIEEKKQSNVSLGRIVGGKHISRKSNYDEKDALEIAKVMIEKQMTYREAEEYFGIPKSTIYEILSKYLTSDDYDSLLKALFEANKKKMSLQEFIAEHNDYEKRSKK